METKTHSKDLGKKICRVREFLGVKQEILAEKLGVSQQTVSKMEQSENVEDSTIEKVAKALGTDSEFIKGFSEELIMSNIQNNYDNVNASNYNGWHCTFNPLDKLMEAIEENKRLYEALLKSEREKITMLEKLLEKK